MKRGIRAVFACILIAGTLTACTGEGEQVNNKLNGFYKIKGDSEENLAAVIFMGYMSEPEKILEKAKQLMEKYDVTVEYVASTDYEMLNADDGDEYYLVLPKYKGTKVKVYLMEKDAYGNTVSERELLDTSRPLVLRCDTDDKKSDVRLSVDFDEESITFLPEKDLEEGNTKEVERIYTE